nr:hypothetical protein RSP673_16595 [Ralstonia solanacearum P673]
MPGFLLMGGALVALLALSGIGETARDALG